MHNHLVHPTKLIFKPGTRQIWIGLDGESGGLGNKTDEQQAVDKEIADLWAGTGSAPAAAATPAATPAAAAAPEPVSAPAAAAAAPVPAAGVMSEVAAPSVTPSTPPEAPAAAPVTDAAAPQGQKETNLSEALRLERDKARQEREKSEKQLLDMQKQLEDLKKEQDEWNTLLNPPAEPTPEEVQVQRATEWAQQQAREAVTPEIQQLRETVAMMQLQSEAADLARTKTDFVERTGWRGRPGELLDPEHPFAQHIRQSPYLVDRLQRSTNPISEMYQAAVDFHLLQPGNVQSELQKQVQSAMAAKDAEYQQKLKELEDRYKGVMSRVIDSAPSPLGSIAAIPGTGATADTHLDIDNLDPYSASTEQRTLLNDELANLYSK